MLPTDNFSLTQLFSLSLSALVFGTIGFFLAKDKGRKILPWTIVSALPLVNIFCLIFLVGSSSLRIERKLDALLQAQREAQKAQQQPVQAAQD